MLHILHTFTALFEAAISEFLELKEDSVMRPMHFYVLWVLLVRVTYGYIAEEVQRFDVAMYIFWV